MDIDRRTFAKTLTAGAISSLMPGARAAAEPRLSISEELARAAVSLPPAIITRIRILYPPNYDPNGAQAFPQSNMVVLVDTDAGITGIGQGGSPDTVRNVARSVIGKNAFDTEMIWQAAFMDGFYSPGKERLHALGAIDLALWDIKGKALNAPLYQFFGGKAREYIQLYATSGLPRDVVPQEDARGMTLSERAAATMDAGYAVYRVDAGIQPNPSGTGEGGGGGGGFGRRGRPFDARAQIPRIIEAVEQIREGVGRNGNWMIDLHQRFDFHESVEVCRLMEPYRPFCVEDPLREEQFRTQIPKLRLMTSVPLAPGEEWGTRWEFSPLVEQRDIDFARASLPNVGGITEMLKIMALCDTHRVGIVPHFTGPIATVGHMHTMMAYPGQVLMEYNQGERPVPYMPEFLECRDGKVWPNERPGLGVSVDESALTFIEEMTEGADGVTLRRPDGSLTHW